MVRFFIPNLRDSKGEGVHSKNGGMVGACYGGDLNIDLSKVSAKRRLNRMETARRSVHLGRILRYSCDQGEFICQLTVK